MMCGEFKVQPLATVTVQQYATKTQVSIVDNTYKRFEISARVIQYMDYMVLVSIMYFAKSKGIKREDIKLTFCLQYRRRSRRMMLFLYQS